MDKFKMSSQNDFATGVKVIVWKNQYDRKQPRFLPTQTTIRQILDNIEYIYGEVYLDGVYVNPKDYDKTLRYFGYDGSKDRDSCYLVIKGASKQMSMYIAALKAGDYQAADMMLSKSFENFSKEELFRIAQGFNWALCPTLYSACEADVIYPIIAKIICKVNNDGVMDDGGVEAEAREVLGTFLNK